MPFSMCEQKYKLEHTELSSPAVPYLATQDYSDHTGSTSDATVMSPDIYILILMLEEVI